MVHDAFRCNRLLLRIQAPISRTGSTPIMQISVDVTEEMRREAELRELPIIDYVEILLERGRQALQDDSVLSNAIERIRALRATTPKCG
jgi:hypothetical protein